MPYSMSLHIGVNEVDTSTYGTVPRLRSAVKDAEAMEAIAVDLEYQDRIVLRDSEATAAAVLSRIGAMAQQVEPGGVALITYAGHGSEVPDDTGDEPSGRDQTWVLYDRMLIDDELRSMWSRFAAGVRIFFVSDSCHSGSVARFFPDIMKDLKYNKPQFLSGSRDIVAGDTPMPRVLPPDAALKAFEKYEDQIASTQWTCGNRDLGDMRATVISLTACQDDEVAGDGANNGLFTAALLQTWNNGQFSGNSDQFLQAIARKTRMYQRPRYEFFGAQNATMLGQKPFMPDSGVLSRTHVGPDGPFIGPETDGPNWDRGNRGLKDQIPPEQWELDWYRRGIEGGHELTTFDRSEPSFRCVLQLNPAASKVLTPEVFDKTVKPEIADLLAVAFQQAHTGLVARGMVIPRAVHGELSGGAECHSSEGRTECSGHIEGRIRF